MEAGGVVPNLQPSATIRPRIENGVPNGIRTRVFTVKG